MGSALTYQRAELVTQQWCGWDQHTTQREGQQRSRTEGQKKKKNENQKWMRWSRVSIHEVEEGGGEEERGSSVTKSRWWHGPRGNSTLATSKGLIANPPQKNKQKKKLAEQFICNTLPAESQYHVGIVRIICEGRTVVVWQLGDQTVKRDHWDCILTFVTRHSDIFLLC